MRIGVISDTHIPEAGPELHPEIRDAFAGVDLILHAGDLHDTTPLDWLETIAPVKCARGNGDEGVVDRRIEERYVLDFDGVTVGMVHGLWYPGGPGIRREIARVFGPDVNLDVLILGDTHVTMLEMDDGILVLNPGSPTFPRNYLKQRGNLAVLTTGDGKASVEMIQLVEGGFEVIARFDGE